MAEVVLSICCRNHNTNIMERLIHITRDHGAPLYPNEKRNQAETDSDLAAWYNAYYPRPIGQWNQWTITREAFRLRARERGIGN